MERKVGDIFEYDGVKLRVEEGTLMCNGCFFKYSSKCDESIQKRGECQSASRSDVGVVFVKVEEKDMEESIKNDRKDGKLMWELLPLPTLEKVVEVYTRGAEKYGPDNWQHLPDGYRRYKAAMFRHLVEYEKGNEFDPETGCHHLAQVAWNAIAILHIKTENI